MRERPRQSVLDDAIDRTVRTMIDVDPLPGFDGRVMRRLEEPRRRAFAWPQCAAAGAALAAILIVALVLRDAPGLHPAQDPKSATTTAHTPPPPPSSSGDADTPPNLPPVPPFTAPAPPSTRRVAARRPVAPAPRDVMAANVEEEMAMDPSIATIAALDPPTALAVHDIEQRPVDVPAIPISRLEIRELNVQPLPAPYEAGKE